MENEINAPKKKRSFNISSAVRKELGQLPKHIREQFLVALEQLSQDLQPGITNTPLATSLPGVMALKINGRPAFRLTYTLKFEGEVCVLAARRKTQEGADKQLIEVTASRLKALK